MTVARGAADTPTASVALPAESFLRLLSGRLDGEAELTPPA